MRDFLIAFPDPEVAIALPTEELAGRLLSFLANRDQGQHGSLHCQNLCAEFNQAGGYPLPVRAKVQEAFVEAWAWLEAQGLLVEPINSPGNNGFRRVSRRGRQLAAEETRFRDYLSAKLLPKEVLHPNIREQVWLNFIRGDYDTAVFQAMKEVEVALRAASGAGEDKLGVKLARFAFHPDTGPLTDTAREGGEKQARADLFAGALGSYKNPQSHRHVALTDPAEAAEQILLANHLLRIINTCVAASAPAMATSAT